MGNNLSGSLAIDLIAKAESHPDFPVVTFENHPWPDEVLTYADIVIKGNKLARAIGKMGLCRGDVFSIIMRNHPETVIAMYAASVLNAVLMPIDHQMKGDQLYGQIKDSGSKGIIADGEFMDSVEEILKNGADVRLIGCLHQTVEQRGPVAADYPDLREILEGPEVPMLAPRAGSVTEPFQINYNWEPGVNPRSIPIGYDRIRQACFLAENAWRYVPQDRLYTGISLSHWNAQMITLFPALYQKIPAVISRQFSKNRIWEFCHHHRCTTFSLLGGMLLSIYAEPPRPDDRDHSVGVVLSTGTPRGLREAFQNRFGVVIHEWYGSGEGGFAHNPPGAGPAGSFGKPMPGMIEMKVIQEDGAECAPYEIGELILRNGCGATGRMCQAVPAAPGAKTPKGWLRSGDMGHQDAKGWFYFDFAKGDGLRRKGEFILPEQVEGVMAGHPDVIDVCVYGISLPSGEPGDSELVAAIVPTPDRIPDIKNIFHYSLARLERNQVPAYIQIVPEIPKSASEKNLSQYLKKKFGTKAENVYRFEE
ncbi:MAG: AMP-binding protein [Deltaproteobacteria bacterium]|nr:AMP-binding protein [Deltaproteobacteria bacterium]